MRQTRNRLPGWIWSMAEAAADASLDYDESQVPVELREAWDGLIDGNLSQRPVVLDLLKTCAPYEAHRFLHWAGDYRELTAEFEIVLKRADCDRATALMYFAWFWQNYYDGTHQWMEDDQHELMCYIRARAWRGEYTARKFDVPEGTLHELAEMRATLVDNRDHPFSLPASFVAMSRKEEMFHKVVEKLLPRKATAESDRH